MVNKGHQTKKCAFIRAFANAVAEAVISRDLMQFIHANIFCIFYLGFVSVFCENAYFRNLKLFDVGPVIKVAQPQRMSATQTHQS